MISRIGHRDSSIFPLLGTLLGNDYVNKDLFENIYTQIHVPKKKKSLMNDQHRRLQGLLEWLKGQSVEDAIDRVRKEPLLFITCFIFIICFCIIDFNVYKKDPSYRSGSCYSYKFECL